MLDQGQWITATGELLLEVLMDPVSKFRHSDEIFRRTENKSAPGLSSSQDKTAAFSRFLLFAYFTYFLKPFQMILACCRKVLLAQSNSQW